MLTTLSITIDTSVNVGAARWMIGNDDIARAMRRLLYAPASYAVADRLPDDLPRAVMTALAASPRTSHLISASLLANAAVDTRPTRPDSPSLLLALLEGDVLTRLARLVGVTLLATEFAQLIDQRLIASLAAELSPGVIAFAQETAPLLRIDEEVSFDLHTDRAAAAIEGAGYRALLEALFREPPWVASRFRLKCPAPLDDRVDLTQVSLESMFAVAIRCARQLPAPWSTLFAPKLR